jgi:predicted Zn-dependent peptidase
MFGFYVAPPDDTLSTEQIAELIDKNVKEGLKALTAEKLLKIKNQMLSETVYLQENPQTAAKFVGEMLLADYSPDEIIHFDEAIKNITVEDVLNAWAKVEKFVVRLNGYLSGETK